MEIRISRRGVLYGVLFGIAATLSGIVVIQYTEAFFLVVIFWIAAPVAIVQFMRWIKARFRSA